MVVESHLIFEKKEFIGDEGRNSKTYVAYDKQLNTDFVVKEINKNSYKDENEYFKESRMLYMCEHPNICKVQWATQNEEAVYFSMPYYKNGSLNKKVSDGNFLTNREIIKYSLDVLSGLHFMHSKKLIHFDIKPSNILITDSNKAVITDFGLSKFLDSDFFTENSIFYTKYRPPEAIEDYKNLTLQSDIYQFGLTLYVMCNGRESLEFQISEVTNSKELYDKILKGEFPDRKMNKPHIDTNLIKIIKKCLEVDLEKRYNSVIEIMNDFSKIDTLLDWKYSENEEEFFLKQKKDGKEITLCCVRENDNVMIKTNTYYFDSKTSRNKPVITIPTRDRRQFLGYLKTLQ